MTIHQPPKLFAYDPAAVAKATGGSLSEGIQGVVFVKTPVRPEPMRVVIGIKPDTYPDGFMVMEAEGTKRLTKKERERAHRFVKKSLEPKQRAPEGDAQEPMPVTEDLTAEDFVAANENRFRYCVTRKAWFEWNGAFWDAVDDEAPFQAIRHYCRTYFSNDGPKVREKALSARFLTSVQRLSRGDWRIKTKADQWDVDPFLLGTPDGTVDLKTGKLWHGEPSHLISKATAVAPADRTDCPRWLQFLHEATGGDADRIAYLKRFCGYALTGDTREHSLLFAHGDGGNGKGVFMATITGVLKDYAATAAMKTFTDDDGHPTDLAKLAGARLVTASESEEGKPWAEAKIKSMTGGDRITARFMNKDFFEYQPQFKVFIFGNHAPMVKSVDDAMRRRLQIVPFTNKPKRRDPLLSERLKAEWPGILRWMIEGCLEWQKVGLRPPESVLTATKDYFEDEDLLGDWLATHCDAEPRNLHKTTLTKDLYASWSAFAKAAGEVPGTCNKFSRTLTKRGFLKGKEGGTGNKLFKGVRLKIAMQEL